MEYHDILLTYTPENTLMQGIKLETQKLMSSIYIENVGFQCKNL